MIGPIWVDLHPRCLIAVHGRSRGREMEATIPHMLSAFFGVFFEKFCVALDVGYVVGVIGIARKDAGKFVEDHF